MENPSPENMPIKKRDLADISLLQAAVEDGKLCEEKLIWPNFLGQEGNKLTAHFFCQIDQKNNMKIIVDWHKKQWLEGTIEELPKDIGDFYGYSKNDIDLWSNGGYGDNLFDKICLTTQTFRRYCRYKSLSM